MSPNKSNARARERAAAARAAQQRAERRRAVVRWTAMAAVLAVVIGVVVGIALSNSGSPKKTPNAAVSSSPGALGPEQMPIEPGAVLAPASTAASGQAVDGIQCQSSEQVAYHIHAHLAVFVNGSSRAIPLGIGTVSPAVQQTSTGGFAQASKCYYWLHTHVQDGVIHIESPTKQIYTLKQFFDEWRQPLSSTQVGPSKGTVTAYLNGKAYTRDPGSIPLSAHATIQLDVGSPTVAPVAVDWSTSTL
jgi:hypothetical protein